MRVIRSVLVSQIAASCSLGIMPAAMAQQAEDIGTVNATAPRINIAPGTPFPVPPPGTPAYVAPSRSPLEASQPTSVVGRSFIDNSTVQSQNYDELIKFVPSVANLQPAGAASQQNYGESIRGFQYTQVNTTFDGIVLPGTVSSFAPQSAAYFTSHDIGSVNVERGPGTASQIGYATFGGTIALLSKAPASTVSINPYGNFGSYQQQLYGIEGDTGIRPEVNGGRGYLDLSRLVTNAYLTGVTTDRSNAFGKWEQPIGESTLLTVVGMANASYGHTAYGATLRQITTLGPNWGLSNNTKDQAFQGYNTDIYNTDFEYIRARSDLGNGFGSDITGYTASYFRRGTAGADPNGTTPNLTGTYYINNVPVRLVNAVQGVSKHNDWRDWGAIGRMTYDTNVGQIRWGLWYDYVDNGVYRTNILLSQGYVNYTTKPQTNPNGFYSQRYNSKLTTVAPYIEFAWHPIPALTVTPGLKFISVQRQLDVTVLSGTPTGKSSTTWTDALPSIDAHLQIRPDWVAYLQYAEGFLAPPQSTLQTKIPATITPQTTTNYQIGTTYQTDRITLGGDAYYIPFHNFIASQSTSQGVLYTNNGGATYKGLEAEATVRVVRGVSAYGNATVNSATFTNGAPVYQAPQRTAALGPILDLHGIQAPDDQAYMSLLWKDIGKQYGQNTTGTNGPIAQYPIKPYNTIDFATTYTLPILNGRKIKVGLNIFNILNNKSLIGLAGTTGGTPTLPLYWTNPGRSIYASIAATL